MWKPAHITYKLSSEDVGYVFVPENLLTHVTACSGWSIILLPNTGYNPVHFAHINSHVVFKMCNIQLADNDIVMWIDGIIAININETNNTFWNISRLFCDVELNAVSVGGMLCRRVCKRTTQFNIAWFNSSTIINSNEIFHAEIKNHNYSALVFSKTPPWYVIRYSVIGQGLTNMKIEFIAVLVTAYICGASVIEPKFKPGLKMDGSIPVTSLYDLTNSAVPIITYKTRQEEEHNINPISLIGGFRPKHELLHIGRNMFKCHAARSRPEFKTLFSTLPLALPHALYINKVINKIGKFIAIHARLENDWKKACKKNTQLKYASALKILQTIKKVTNLNEKTICLLCGDIEKKDRLIFEPCIKRSEINKNCPGNTYTHQSLYDFEMALHADEFFGHSQSTFSIAVVNERKKRNLPAKFYI
jgi:hypothetical protein